jgi:hypothetical protein
VCLEWPAHTTVCECIFSGSLQEYQCIRDSSHNKSLTSHHFCVCWTALQVLHVCISNWWMAACVHYSMNFYGQTWLCEDTFSAEPSEGDVEQPIAHFGRSPVSSISLATHRTKRACFCSYCFQLTRLFCCD